MEAILQPLGQQELEPPAPGRTIAAQTGATWWGCDPSTKRLSVGYVRQDGSRGVSTRSFAQGRNGERLGHIYAETQDFAVQLVAEAGRPGFIMVEQPFGKHVPPVSYMVVGVIMAAFDRCLRVPCETVPVPTWKKLALGDGFGGAPKAAVMRWARTLGYAGVLEDEADALAIAVAASRSVGFRAT